MIASRWIEWASGVEEVVWPAVVQHGLYQLQYIPAQPSRRLPLLQTLP